MSGLSNHCAPPLFASRHAPCPAHSDGVRSAAPAALPGPKPSEAAVDSPKVTHSWNSHSAPWPLQPLVQRQEPSDWQVPWPWHAKPPRLPPHQPGPAAPKGSAARVAPPHVPTPSPGRVRLARCATVGASAASVSTVRSATCHSGAAAPEALAPRRARGGAERPTRLAAETLTAYSVAGRRPASASEVTSGAVVCTRVPRPSTPPSPPAPPHAALSESSSVAARLAR